MESSLLDTSILVIEQRRKLFEMRNQYRILDEAGAPIGAVEQETQSALTFLARLGTDPDVALPVTLTVTGCRRARSSGPAQAWFRMALSVSRPDGSRLGTVTKRIRLGKARFALSDAAGSELGEIRAENWRAKDFSVVDHSGSEVARAAKRWRGPATEVFTDADTYVLNLPRELGDPLRSLALGASLVIDLVMKQKDY